MNKFLVQISAPEVRELLVASFEKVGKPESLTEFLIVQTNKDIRDILSIDGVISAEFDLFEPPQSVPVNQDPAPEWALPWLSKTAGSYANKKTGAGVDIYIVDSGIRDNNTDLEGRVETIYSFDGEPYSMTGTSPSHGTSVAGCAASKTFGTAKGATMLNCRIDFFMSSILKAADTILKHHLEKPDNRQSVVNLSLASSSPLIGNIFEKLVKYGVVVIAASGNDTALEPKYPAKNPSIVAVGGINSRELPAYFTNRGANVYAPAQDVPTLSVFLAGNTPIPYSGTSFACPYYAGLMACLLEGSDKFNTADLVGKFRKQALAQMDKGRIPDFDNTYLPVITANTNGFDGTYYLSPSAAFTNEEIKAYLLENAGNPQLIADVCREFNLSLNRLSTLSLYTKDELNKYFFDAGVVPWWV